MDQEKKYNQVEPWIGEEEKKAVAEYLDSGAWLTEFKKTKEFEEEIAKYVGAKYASVVNNGTVSLFCALSALNIKPGDEVIVPDYTMIASANAIVLAGAKPVFADINPQTLCLDLENTREAITKKTKAVMLVTINGRFPKMEEFVKLCQEKNLYLIEDAAQSLGSKYQGKFLGTFGQIGSFSFSPHKIITTGQGGALVTDDEELYAKILKVKDFGRTKPGIDCHETMGFNFKFTDLQSVIGLEQIKKIDWRVNRKKEMYKCYQKNLAGIPGLDFIETSEETAPWFMDILVARETRDKLAEFLKLNGISTRPFYPAIHTQPPYSWVKGSFPNSSNVSQQGLWLPSSSFLSDNDIEYICQKIKKFYES